MKKIFTLLLAMGSLTMVFAQSGRYGNTEGNRNRNVTTYQPNNHFQNNQYSNNDQGRYSENQYGKFNDNRNGFDKRNERVVVVEHRNDRMNDHNYYAKPFRNHRYERSFGRRDFRNREW